MVSGLEISTSPSSVDGTVNKKQPPTTLPSFDDLLRSLGRQDEDLRHHLRHGLHQAHHHAHPQPYPAHHAHHPHPGHHDPIRRPPSTPPTPSTGSYMHDGEHSPVHNHVQHVPGKATRGRPRANTAPSVSNTHLSSPFCCHRSLSVAHSTEHCADRVRALKDGDGEWNSWSFDAVAPSALPYHARPHLHSRTSTSSLPSHPSCSPLHHPHHPAQSYFSPTPVHNPTPASRPVTIPSHHRTPSYGSHSSPLSTSVPLTPQSIFSACDDVEMRSAGGKSRTPTPTPSTGYGGEGKKGRGGVAMATGGVRIPTLPKMC
ncbi:hypothetical protein IAT38_000596 [Cryptococcus sp. DSM 104549]